MQTLRRIAAGLLVLAVLGALGAAVSVGAHYRDRIYPGVSIQGIDVGDLTVAAARSRLASALPVPKDLAVTIVAGEEVWDLTWARAGQSYDLDAAVDAAYQIGRDRPWWLGAILVLRPSQVSITVPISPADPARVQAYIEEIAAAVKIAPRNASLTILGGQVRSGPAHDGQELDVEAATAQTLTALREGAGRVELTLDVVPPAIATAEPTQSQIEARLSESLTLVVQDPLTGDPEQGGYYAEFTAERDQIAQWLRVVQDEGGFRLRYDTNAIRTWVGTIAPQLGEERLLDVEATSARVADAIRSNANNPVYAEVRHPPKTYIVQLGDTFYDIAYNHGFSQWQLERVNPEVDPGLIDVGQVITVPSIDILFPHPLVRGKRIEIDLPTQTLRAYEEETLVYEFRVSSGISTTPTLAGQFQILFKEEMAFAQRWSLDMPYFMAFYEEREDFYNGIHELPITSYGLRLSKGVLGYPASYGCIILDIGDAETLYNWADIGTLVRVTGVAPGTPFGQQTLLDVAPPTGDEP
ncbi:MAG: L,D-transpeptidase family protein [Anaerolineae bacterium]